MTARVLIRLSSMLEDLENSERVNCGSSGQEKMADATVHEPNDEAISKLSMDDKPSTLELTNSDPPAASIETYDPLDLLGPIGVNEGHGMAYGNGPNKKRKHEEAQPKSQFAHVGMFDCLGSERDAEGSQESPSSGSKELSRGNVEVPSSARKEGPEDNVSEPDARYITRNNEPYEATTATGEQDDDGFEQFSAQPLPSLEAPLMMPRWDSEFWSKYANKLCVNGTVEGECDLAGWRGKENISPKPACSLARSPEDAQTC